jgi:hypothetical protein
VQEDAVLRFTTDAGIPFTNNLAERPVRMIKVRAKISGRFRSREHAVGFLRMRSFHDTCRKHGIGHYEAIKMCVEGKIPALVTEALSGKAKPQASRKAA